MAKRKRPQFTAIHEAGHVVALAVLGLAPRSATIVRESGTPLTFMEELHIQFEVRLLANRSELFPLSQSVPPRHRTDRPRFFGRFRA